MSAGRALRVTLFVGAASLAVAPAQGGAPATPSEIVEQLAGLDKMQVTVAGKLGQVHAHLSKKGERSYSFSLSDDANAVTVLARTRPACAPGTRVEVDGIVDRLSRRIDASRVSCE